MNTMSDFRKLLREIRQTNLCTWYLLPLTGLSKFSFGEGLFINSYLEPKKLWIIVQVPDINLVSRNLIDDAIKVWSNDRGGFLAYKISNVWKEEVFCYLAGAYSKFSDDLKQLIFDHSGLPYRQPDDKGRFYTDIRLMALEGREELKQYLREELNVTDLPDELLLPPSPESFMDVTEV
jgi:hypothetical protein